MIETSHAADDLQAVTGYGRAPAADLLVPRGLLHVVLTGPDGAAVYDEYVENLITQVGDQYYGERAAGISGAPAIITGMQLGTGSTAPAKTGTGAALVTLVASSLVAIGGGFPTSALNADSPAGRRIAYQVTWGAGVATSDGIVEVVLTNQAVSTQTAAPAANTIARALLSPVVNKGSQDTLTVTWNHDLRGA